MAKKKFSDFALDSSPALTDQPVGIKSSSNKRWLWSGIKTLFHLAITLGGNMDANSKLIQNLADPVDVTDAVNKQFSIDMANMVEAADANILTDAERSAITTNTAKVSADGSVTSHSDVTDAGSGIIISDAERAAIGSGGGYEFIMDLPPGAWQYPSVNYAPFVTVVGVNRSIDANAFDDTLDESMMIQFTMPPGLDSTDTIYFEVEGFAETSHASNNLIELDMQYKSSAHGADWDTALTSWVQTDLVCEDVQNELDLFIFSDTVANLSTGSNQQMRLCLKRSATTTTANELADRYFVTNVRMRVARSG